MLRAASLLARHARQHGQGLSAAARGSESFTGGTAALAACHNVFSNQRSFADAAAAESEQTVQLPTQVYGLAGKYASALYIAGVKENSLEQVEDDLVEVWNTAAKSNEFRDFLRDPTIPKKDKGELLDTVLQDLDISELTRRFMGLLAENNRLPDIVRIINTFDDLMSAARGEVVATITTAADLAQGDLEEIKNGLNSILEQGQTLILNEKVDPTIIGGVIIDVGDKNIDLSISSRLKRIQNLMVETL